MLIVQLIILCMYMIINYILTHFMTRNTKNSFSLLPVNVNLLVAKFYL